MMGVKKKILRYLGRHIDWLFPETGVAYISRIRNHQRVACRGGLLKNGAAERWGEAYQGRRTLPHDRQGRGPRHTPGPDIMAHSYK